MKEIIEMALALVLVLGALVMNVLADQVTADREAAQRQYLMLKLELDNARDAQQELFLRVQKLEARP